MQKARSTKSEVPVTELDEGIIELGSVRTLTQGFEQSGASDGTSNEYKEFDG